MKNHLSEELLQKSSPFKAQHGKQEPLLSSALHYHTGLIWFVALQSPEGTSTRQNLLPFAQSLILEFHF